MTTEQKSQIAAMRKQGCTYAKNRRYTLYFGEYDQDLLPSGSLHEDASNACRYVSSVVSPLR
jgi:hypothetical protein